VAEVPWSAGLDGLVALGALHFAGCYLGFPLFAGRDVFGAVASLLAGGSCLVGFCLVGGAEGACVSAVLGHPDLAQMRFALGIAYESDGPRWACSVFVVVEGLAVAAYV
jgi:hypothetical protein